MLAYRDHPAHRSLEDPPAVWREGNTRVLDFGATHRAARGKGVRHSKRWLSFSAPAKGQIQLDSGARRAIVEQGKSLLAAGITMMLGWGPSSMYA